MAAEEAEQEVEAMEAVYGPDCTVFRLFPPHLTVSMKPRTADDLSVQFVEIVLVIKAGEQYPEVPPELELKDAKGLGDGRQSRLLRDLHAQAIEISGGPMLVAICEAATDLLTDMNFPEGDCCFCLDSLVMADDERPFMKLMSCFHCFHRDCFGDWWRWLQQQQQHPPRPSLYPASLEEDSSDERSLEHTRSSSQRRFEATQELLIHCPVCRTVINGEDVAHVQDYLASESGLKSVPNAEDTKVPMTILTEAEQARRSQFTAEFEARQARGAIIENKKLEVIQPGMLVPARTLPPEETLPREDQEEYQVPTDLNRSSSMTSNVLTRETRTEARGRDHTHARQTHLNVATGRDGFRGGRSYRGHMGGRLKKKTRHSSNQGRYDIAKDLGIGESSRVQSQDTSQLERGVVHESSLQTSDHE